jgi:hypothetical protein
MYFVVRRTWLAGADPTDQPDLVKTVARAASREAAEVRAAALACSAKRAAQLDADRKVWFCKAPDALHVFEVCRADEMQALESDAKTASIDVMRASRRLLGSPA